MSPDLNKTFHQQSLPFPWTNRQEDLKFSAVITAGELQSILKSYHKKTTSLNWRSCLRKSRCLRKSCVGAVWWYLCLLRPLPAGPLKWHLESNEALKEAKNWLKWFTDYDVKLLAVYAGNYSKWMKWPFSLSFLLPKVSWSTCADRFVVLQVLSVNQSV